MTGKEQCPVLSVKIWLSRVA